MWQVAYTAKEGGRRKMIVEKESPERHYIYEGITKINEAMNKLLIGELEAKLEIALAEMDSKNLDRLMKAVLREVLRRGIKDREISLRVYLAAEILLLKEE